MTPKIIGTISAVLLFGAVSTEAVAQRATVVTNQQGSLAYSAGAAMAKVMNEKLGTQARIQPTGGSSTYYPLLNRGEAQYGFSSAIEILFGQTGTEIYKGMPHKNVLIIGGMFDLLQALVVANDSPAKKASDVRGMRIGSKFTSQKIVIYTQNALLANAGIKPNEMKGVPFPNAVGPILGVGKGKTDTSFAPPGSGVVANLHASLSSRGGARFLPINTSPAAIAAMRKIYPPANVKLLKPAKNRPGILSEIPVMAYPFLMIAGRATPDDQVYKLTKMIHQNKKALAKAFPVYNRFNPKNMAKMKQGEFHPGAIRYYKEVGLWTR
jgi:TRAP transporter TAXI family solute receptor